MCTVQRLIAENRHVAGKIDNPVKVRVVRPRARRYSFVASVELVDLQSDVQYQARVTDLSLYGCGATASKPLPAGTHLRVRITSKGSTFSAHGKVAYATSDGNMGIVFTRVERHDQTILEKWIGELRDR
jgi:CDGSH-type Zn-finger protein